MILSFLWLVGCLGVVTILTSTASMYQTVVKCVRYERGGVFAEFWDAYKKNLRQGVVLTLAFGAVGALLGWGDYQVFFVLQSRSAEMFTLTLGLTILSIVYLLNVIWLVPVFSRFSNSFWNIIRLNYVIAMKNLLRSIPIVLILAAMVIVFLAVNVSILLLPALAALGNSFFSEPALHRFMPPQEEEGDWRYGDK